MSEFGNETATATMKTTQETLKALLKLLQWIANAQKRHRDAEIKKLQRDHLKVQAKQDVQKSLRQELNNKRGEVRERKLFNSGEALTPIPTKMSADELKRLNHYANVYGVIYASVSDKTVKEEIKRLKNKVKDLLNEKEQAEENGEEWSEERQQLLEQKQSELRTAEEEKTMKIVTVRTKDLPIFNEIFKRMDLERMKDRAQSELEMLSKKEHKTEEDLKRIEELKQEIKELDAGDAKIFNDEGKELIFDDAFNKLEKQRMDFDHAVNFVTCKGTEENPYIICDRNNPLTYAKVYAVKEERIGADGKSHEYVNTTFETYNNGERQYSDESRGRDFTRFTDAKGAQTSSYGEEKWGKIKEELEQKSGLGNDIIAFSNSEDFEKYQELYEKKMEEIETKETENTEEITGEENSRDYNAIAEKLEEQKNNMKYTVSENGDIVNKETGEIEVPNGADFKELSKEKGWSDEKMADICICKNISDQIQNYEAMNIAQLNLAMTKQDIEQMQESEEFPYTDYENANDLIANYNDDNMAFMPSCDFKFINEEKPHDYISLKTGEALDSPVKCEIYKDNTCVYSASMEEANIDEIRQKLTENGFDKEVSLRGGCVAENGQPTICMEYLKKCDVYVDLECKMQEYKVVEADLKDERNDYESVIMINKIENDRNTVNEKENAKESIEKVDVKEEVNVTHSEEKSNEKKFTEAEIKEKMEQKRQSKEWKERENDGKEVDMEEMDKTKDNSTEIEAE